MQQPSIELTQDTQLADERTNVPAPQELSMELAALVAGGPEEKNVGK